MSITLPPVPYKSSLVDKTGFLTPAWSGWFRDVFQRIGGTVAPSNNEIAELQATTTSQGSSIDATETTVDSILDSIEALNQGRQL